MQLFHTSDNAPSGYTYTDYSFSYVDYEGLKLPVFTKNGASYVFSAFRYGGGIPISDLSHYLFREFKGVIFATFQAFDPLQSFSYSASYYGFIRLGIEHLGKYCVFSQSELNSFSYTAFFDTLDDAINDVFNRAYSVPAFATMNGYIANSSLPAYPYIFKINSFSFGEDVVFEGDPQYWTVDVNVEFKYFSFFPVLYGSCCYPDFAPIVKSLGGIPVTDQSQNLILICQLLGIDTNTPLTNCEAMKEYLKRVLQNLGGLPSPEPNENLKSICYLLGVDDSAKGLTDCELSKDYVKRNSIMLGAE